MESTEEQRKAAHCAGITVEEWQRRGRVALSSQRKTAGGVVMCQVNHHSNGVVRMDGLDDGNTALMNSKSSSELARLSRKYLDDFIAGGDAADLARGASLISAALARAARR